jgi:hypothetical protein
MIEEGLFGKAICDSYGLVTNFFNHVDLIEPIQTGQVSSLASVRTSRWCLKANLRQK